MHKGYNFSKFLPIFVIYHFFGKCDPNGYEVIYIVFYIRLLIKMDTDDYLFNKHFFFPFF